MFKTNLYPHSVKKLKEAKQQEFKRDTLSKIWKLVDVINFDIPWKMQINTIIRNHYTSIRMFVTART